MKTIIPNCTLLWWCVLNFALCPDAHAAVVIVDTFDQGGFAISLPELNENDETVNLPLGERRIIAYKLGAVGATATALSRTLDATTGTLSFLVNGTSPKSTFPLGLQLIYAGGGPRNISGGTEFILGFSELSGVGTLYVELGSSNGLEGVFRVDLTGPGEVRYPVSGVYAGAGHTLDSFNVLRFIFEARSTEFSFTLDEIRLIPEPSAALLALAAGAGCLTLRRRRPCAVVPP